MAEPTNTPIPASTPRSASPVHANYPPIPHFSTPTSPLSPVRHAYSSSLSSSILPPSSKPRVLHIGDPVRYNPETYLSFVSQCDVVRPSAEDRQRPAFIAALRERKWGDFHAIFRPFWGSGGEMGSWDSELIDLLPPSVQIFASAGAGFDWADTKLLGERGIVYCNSGLAAAEAVADFAVAMVISTFRHLPWGMAAATSDEDDFLTCHKDATAQSHNLRGHKLGLIGLGNIGRQIATRCYAGFGMKIHYYDVVPIAPEVEASLGGAVAHTSLKSLIQTADCVVLCAPAIPPSSSASGILIGAEELSWFSEGGRFVNIARGSLVDDAAVGDALESGRLSSAALDVHHDEPRVHPKLKEMAKKGRVMVTSHNAGGTIETHKGFEELSMRNIMAVLAGGEPITPVNSQYLKK